LPGQSVDVRFEVAAAGVSGKTTEFTLEQSGIPVAMASHTWAPGETAWSATLRYRPPGGSATTLRLRASTIAGETDEDDNVADVPVPAVRGPVRVLIVEAAVTWPAVFVRRALEEDAAIAVSSLQRAAKSVATRAGNPPPALTRGALAPFEAVVIGGPEELRAPDVDALRWFVEQRGGVAIFVPDRLPSGRYLELLGAGVFRSRALETPARVGRALQASELVVPARLPPAATVHAVMDDAAIVWSARRGAGAIVFSGALDAWRQRDDAFGEFWRGLLIANAASVPSPLDVDVQPSAVRPGERVHLTARFREVPDGEAPALPPVTARVVSPGAKTDQPVRLWPTAEPGVYEGEWRAPADGVYNVSVTGGDMRGDAIVTVTSAVRHASSADPDALALAAAATGGRAFPASDIPALVEAMTKAHPSRRGVRPRHLMRSAWWILPFAGLLCVEWAVRRKRGLP
jgi:hypothetical protein